MRFNDNLNSHDLEYVKKFAYEHNIKIHYHDLSILDFWNSKIMLDIADSVSSVSPILASHLWLAEQIKGVPVIAQGEPHLKKSIPDSYIPGVSPYIESSWHLVESERLCSLYQYFIQKNKPAVPGFFQYLPEQIYSFCFANKMMTNLVENKIVGKLGTRSSKNQMIHQFYPEIQSRPKFTGFEKIEVQHNFWRQFLANRFPNSDHHYKVEYEDLRKMLS